LDKDTKTSKVTRKFKQLWAAAYVRAEDNLHWGSVQQKAWAHASMAELQILSLSWKDPAKHLKRCRAEAIQHVERALDIREMRQYEQANFDVRSLRHQLVLYSLWEWGTDEMKQLGDELYWMIRARGGPQIQEPSPAAAESTE
jgi:hypothetical protein